MTLSLNGLKVSKVEIFTPYHGTWLADVDVELPPSGAVPSGKATLVLNTTTLLGTVDPDGSGAIGEKCRVRVLGGGGGWHKQVVERQFHNEATVLSSAVIAATAAEVGETATDLAPAALGVDYLRQAGPASRVLADREWYVDGTTGTTIVGPRVPRPQTPDIQILDWDPIRQAATLVAETLIVPGTILVDTRIGTAEIRDVRQTFSGEAPRATAFCGSSTKARLAALLRNLVREHGRTALLGTYHYRIASNGPDGRITAVAVSRTAGVPDVVLLPDWYGVPGMNATPALLAPGTECAVSFLDGDPAKPFVHSFKGGDTLASPVATQASTAAFMTALASLNTALTALLGSTNPLAVVLDPTAALTTAVASAATALSLTIPAAFSLKTKAS
jgi:hypothetical protein